jgi:di/tricarboxylate transporter
MRFFLVYLFGVVFTFAAFVALAIYRERPIDSEDGMMIAGASFAWPVTWLLMLLFGLGQLARYLTGGEL